MFDRRFFGRFQTLSKQKQIREVGVYLTSLISM